jgi:hypothetical protein
MIRSARHQRSEYANSDHTADLSSAIESTACNTAELSLHVGENRGGLRRHGKRNADHGH